MEEVGAATESLARQRAGVKAAAGQVVAAASTPAVDRDTDLAVEQAPAEAVGLGHWDTYIGFILHGAYAFVTGLPSSYRARSASICLVRSAIAAQLLPSVIILRITGPFGP